MIILALITLIGTLAIGILSVNRILIMERGSESVLRASIEEDYDENIKNQVDNAVSMLDAVYAGYENGDYSYEEAETRGADLLRELRYGNGGYTDYVFPKEGETESSPKRSYSRAFEPFGWVVGTGNYIDYIDETVEKETQAMRENVKTALIAIIGTGSLLIVIVMAVCLYMAFSLSRSFQVAQIQKVTEEVTSSVAQLSSDAEQLLAFVGNDVVASYDMFDEVADAYNQDAGKIDALISDFSATSEELLASIDGVLDAMEGIATATNEGAKGTTDIAQKTVEVKSEADT